MRLGSFNLCSGRSLADGSASPARLADAVRTLDVDVLAIQEVDRLQARTGGVDQAQVVAAAAEAVDHRFVPTVLGEPGSRDWQAAHSARSGAPASGLPDSVPSSAAEVDGAPDYGIGLVSRAPVEAWSVLHLPPARGRWPLAVPDGAGGARIMWLPDEPRAVLAAVLVSPRMTVACTHLSFVPGWNIWQLRKVRRWLAGLPDPLVLLGDLNLPMAVVTRTTGWTPLVSGPTFPAREPRLQLDHALVRGLPRGTRSAAEVVELPLSDHRAIRATLSLP